MSTTTPDAAAAAAAAATTKDNTSSSSKFEIPKVMKRLVVTSPGNDLKSCTIQVEEVPVPIPTSSQVLIKVIAASVNPSDYGSWYRCKVEQCPYVMGKEGCGIVVATGGGLSTYTTKIGSKVGIIGLKQQQGTYSEYVVTEAIGGAMFPLPNDLPTEDAAAFFVNPYTCIAIIDTMKRQHPGISAFVMTAAASQLGIMMNKLAPMEGIEIINVVRRSEQMTILQTIGAKHIIVTSEDNENWKDTLQETCQTLQTHIAFDAVAGNMTGDLISILPPKGIVYVFGFLDGNCNNIDSRELIYKEKQVKGFILTNWVLNGGILSMIPRMLVASQKVNSGLMNISNGWSRSQFKDITSLEMVHEEIISSLNSSITGYKLRIRFDL